MLDQLQDESLTELWGGEEPQGSVVACDFYNAGALLGLPDEEVVDIFMKDLLPDTVPDFGKAKVVDSWVGVSLLKRVLRFVISPCHANSSFSL